MRSLTFLSRAVVALTGPCSRRYIRAVVSLLVALSLLAQAFPQPGQTGYGRPRPVPVSPLANPVDALKYASSFFALYPGMALAQGGTITKTAPITTTPGSIISYPIVVNKTTTSTWAVGSTWITDSLPTYTGGPSGAPEPEWSYTFNNGVGRFQNIALITVTGLVTVGNFNIVVNSPLVNGTLITNTANLSTATGTEVSPVVTTTVVSGYTLDVAKSDTPDPVQAGAVLSYTIAYTVGGNGASLGAIVTDSIPANTSFNSASGGVTPVGGVLTWNLGDLGAPMTGVLTFCVDVNEPLLDGIVLTNTVYFSDTVGGTASDTVTTTVNSDHAISFLKNGVLNPVQAGEIITYTMTYIVTGNEPAINATITDAVPANTAFLSGSGGVTPVNGVLTWTLGTLNPVAVGSVTYTVRVTSPLPNNTLITNTARFSDSSGGYEEASETVVVQSSHDLHLAKSDYPDPVGAGATLTYTLAYSVTGNESASGAAITDAVPANTVYSSCAGAPCGEAGGQVTWNVGALNPGDSGLLTMVVTVTTPLSDGTVLTNTGHLYDSNGGTPVSATVTTTVVSTHTLDIAKSDDPYDPVPAGSLLTYTINYTVTGTEAALNATITDAVPANTDYAGCGGAPCSQAGGIVTWVLGTPLTPTASGLLTLVVTVTAPLSNGTVLTNTARFYDSNGGVPVSATVTTTVVSSHTLHIAKSDSPDPVDAGATLTYTLAYSVTGNESASGVTITDAVPANTVYASCAGAPCGEAGGQVTWNVGTLNPGDSGLLTLVVTVTAPLTNGTVLTNTGHLYDSNGGPPVSATVTTTVSSSHALTVTKDDAADPVSVGGSLVYLINYTVSGNEPASGVTITDAVPISTTYAGCGGAPCSQAGGIVTWTLGAISPPVSGTVVLTVDVDGGLADGTILTNTAYLYDDDGLTASDVETTTVRRVVLAVSKAATPPHGSTVSPGQTITYTVTVTNTGTATATNVVVTDSIPADTTYVPGSVGGSGIVYETDPLTMTVASMVVSDVVTMTFRVTVNLTATSGAIIGNSATASGDQTTLQSSNTVTHLVSSVLGLSIAKSAVPVSGSGVLTNSVIRYDITVVNTGTAMATDVTISDSIPANTAYAGGLSYSSGASGSAPPVQVVTPTLLPGGTLTATFLVTVSGGAVLGTVISNQAVVTATGGLLVSSNVVTHVVTTTVGSSVYLPIILKNYVYPPGPTPPPTSTPTPTPTPEPCYPELVTVVPVGVSPRGVAVDSANNRIYVANHASGSVSVINGATNSVVQTVGGVPGANGIAYDGTNNRLYVTNRENGSLTIIETVGHTLVGMVAVGALPNGVAYNPVTNKIYVANFGGGTVTIFDAASPAVPLATLGGFGEPSHIAVDTTTGKVYVTNHGAPFVTVINGVTDSVITNINLLDSLSPYGIAIDTVRHYAYVVTIDTFRIVTIDTNTDSLLNPWTEIRRLDSTPVPLRVVAVDGALGASGHLYITTASSDGGFDKLLVIPKGFDEGFNRPFAIDTGANPIEGVAVNLVTHRVYVTARDSNQVTVVQDGEPACIWNFAQDYVLVQGYFPE